jgi:hypothetical protein
MAVILRVALYSSFSVLQSPLVEKTGFQGHRRNDPAYPVSRQKSHNQLYMQHVNEILPEEFLYFQNSFPVCLAQYPLSAVDLINETVPKPASIGEFCLVVARR